MVRELRQYDGCPIYSKEQSRDLVHGLGMNSVESRIITEGNMMSLDTISFLYKYGLYGVRYMKFGMPSQYGLTRPEVLKFLKRHLKKEHAFRVEQSLRDHDRQNMIVQGEFLWVVTNMFEHLTGMYSVLRGHSLKEINHLGRPIEGIVEHWWGFRRVKDILMLHNLKNVVVELTLYNCRLGMWNDDYICWELRNLY